MSCAANEPHSGVGSRDEEESEKTDEAEEEEGEDIATGEEGFLVPIAGTEEGDEVG
jgi:hypothetical protein